MSSIIFQQTFTRTLARRTVAASLPRQYTQGSGYGRGHNSSDDQDSSQKRDQVKEQIGQKQTRQQAQRQSNLGASNEEIAAKGEGGTSGPAADETVEQGGPFSRGYREADKQSKHTAALSSNNSGEGGEKQQPRSREAAEIAKESRETGGYSQMRSSDSDSDAATHSTPPTGAGLSGGARPSSVWMTMRASALMSSLGGVLTRPSNNHTPTFSDAMLLSMRFSSSSSGAPPPRSTEERNSMKQRGMREDGSSPQSNGQPIPNEGANEQKSTPPSDAPAAPRSQTKQGVDPSFKRASGMPSDPQDEATPPHNSASSLDSINAHKQPQKDKSTVQSVKEAFAPSTPGGGSATAGGGKGAATGTAGAGADGIAEPECAPEIQSTVKSIKEGVQQVLSGFKKVVKEGGKK